MKKLYENWSWEIFPGYYDTNLGDLSFYDDEASDGYYFIFKDFNGYVREMNSLWVQMMDRWFDDNPVGLKIGAYKSMRSPREYNFTTDKICLEVEVNLNRLKRYCWIDNKDAFNEYLNKNWSSYDGFMSFIPNNIVGFRTYYKRGRKKADLIDVMIEFYLRENIDFEAVEEYSLEKKCEIIENYLALEDSEDYSLWDFCWDNSKDRYVPAERISA